MEFKGFTRVVINKDAEATTPSRALEMGIVAEIGFLRNDGWSLGTPLVHQDVAYQLWHGQWTHFIRKGETTWRPISQLFS